MIGRVCLQPGDEVLLTGSSDAHQSLPRGLLGDRHSSRAPDELGGRGLDGDAPIGEQFQHLCSMPLDAGLATVDGGGGGLLGAAWPLTGRGHRLLLGGGRGGSYSSSLIPRRSNFLHVAWERGYRATCTCIRMSGLSSLSTCKHSTTLS